MSARFLKPCGRRRQEYFFTSASLLDLIRRHMKQWGDVRTLGEHAAVQLNDTHPAIGISELMSILVPQPPPVAGSARNLARAADGARAAAPHADHLPHQCSASRQRATTRVR